MPIEIRVDSAGELTPRGPTDDGDRDTPKNRDEVVGVLRGEYLHPLGPAAVQGYVNVGEHPGQLGPAWVSLSESVSTLVLVFSQLDEPLFRGSRFRRFVGVTPQLSGRLLAGTGDGIVVSTSPPSLAGLLRPAYRIVKSVLGVPAG